MRLPLRAAKQLIVLAISSIAIVGDAAKSGDERPTYHLGDAVADSKGSSWAVAFAQSRGREAGVMRVSQDSVQRDILHMSGRYLDVRVPRLLPLSGGGERPLFLWCATATSGSPAPQNVLLVQGWDFVSGFQGPPVEVAVPAEAIVDWCCIAPGHQDIAILHRPYILGGRVPRLGGKDDIWTRLVAPNEEGATAIGEEPFRAILGDRRVHVGAAIDVDGAPIHTFLVSGERTAWRWGHGVLTRLAVSDALLSTIRDAEQSNARIHPLACPDEKLLVVILRPGDRASSTELEAHTSGGLIGVENVHASPGAVRYGAAFNAAGWPQVVVSRFGMARCDAVWIDVSSVSSIEVLRGEEVNSLGTDWGQRLWLSVGAAATGDVYKILSTRTGELSNEARVWVHSVDLMKATPVSLDGAMNRFGLLDEAR